MKSISSFALSKEIPLFILALAILFPHALTARPPYDKRSGAYPNGSYAWMRRVQSGQAVRFTRPRGACQRRPLTAPG